MTRDEIVASVNRLSVGYNVTWHEIAEDADEAIHKINSYLGAEYPLMSDILTEPNSIYAVKQVVDGQVKLISIFPDIYIRTIVIPFIASEILSRDEEFTTIYNKYAMDVENGLFTMFQNEFNRVPHLFRQKDTTGVFFPEDYEKVHPEIDRSTRYVENEFHIRYHLNQDDIIYTGASIPNDKYTWQETYTLFNIDPTEEYLSTDYAHYYKFDRWYKDAMYSAEASGSGTIHSDIDVYARWSRYDAFNTIPFSLESDDTKYIAPIVNKIILKNDTLVFPQNINGYIINSIKYSDCFTSIQYAELSSIKKIALPYYGIRYIQPNFFVHFENLEEILFYGNASESSTASNTTIIDTNNLIYSNSINHIDTFLIDNIRLNWSRPGLLSVYGTKVTKLTIPNSVFSINIYSFLRSSVQAGHFGNPVNSALEEVLALQGHLVEVWCDWTEQAKPSTFSLSEGQEIYEWDDTKYYKYVVHFRNPKKI